MSFLEDVVVAADRLGVLPTPEVKFNRFGYDQWLSTAGRYIIAMEKTLGLAPAERDQLGVRFRAILKAMPKVPKANLLLVTGFYKVETMRAYPHVTFVFGDNCQRQGKGGQAIVRDEPNVLGVATKKSGGEFFIDGDIADMGQLCEDLIAVESLLLAGRKVGIPITDEGRISLGCGLAALPYHFPSAYAFLEAWLRRMTKKYPTSTLKL